VGIPNWDRPAQVSGVNFRIHGFLFVRESEEARGVLASAVDGVIVLDDVQPADFRRFLKAVYLPYVRGPFPTPSL
jgi:hypothetical protein